MNTEELKAMLDAAPGTNEDKQRILLEAIDRLSPLASEEAAHGAGGSFLAILMELLKVFLPILLGLLKDD